MYTWLFILSIWDCNLIVSTSPNALRFSNLYSSNQGCLANPPKLTWTNPTHLIWSIFNGWWVELGHEIFFTVGHIGFGYWDLQICLTWPDPPIFNIFLKIYYIIFFFLFLNKTCRRLFLCIATCLPLEGWLC